MPFGFPENGGANNRRRKSNQLDRHFDKRRADVPRCERNFGADLRRITRTPTLSVLRGADFFYHRVNVTKQVILPQTRSTRTRNTFWVSSGSTPGQGPTPSKPEWLKFNFPREVSVKKFQVAPRTVNGGYGPKNIQMLLNGFSVFTGTVPATATLEVDLPQALIATNAQLLMTSSYDPSFPTNSRNVQVVEVVFLERALPGSFGEWLLARFDNEEIENENISGANGDPDGDGVFNLFEFATGGNPMLADSGNSELVGSQSTNGVFSLRFVERANLGGVMRQIYVSTNLNVWSHATPVEECIVNDSGTFQIRKANFSVQSAPAFFRLGYNE